MIWIFEENCVVISKELEAQSLELFEPREK